MELRQQIIYIGTYYGRIPIKEIAKQTGLSHKQVVAYACQLRKDGIPLPRVRGESGAYKQAVVALKAVKRERRLFPSNEEIIRRY